MNKNLKQILILLLSLLTTVHTDIYCQKLEGVVFDRNNQIPVFNANVYLEGATLFTTTDSLGRF